MPRSTYSPRSNTNPSSKKVSSQVSKSARVLGEAPSRILTHSPLHHTMAQFDGGRVRKQAYTSTPQICSHSASSRAGSAPSSRSSRWVLRIGGQKKSRCVPLVRAEPLARSKPDQVAGRDGSATCVTAALSPRNAASTRSARRSGSA